MQSLKDPVHQSFKCGWGIAKSKRHDLELKEARMSGKGSLAASFRWKWNLQITTSQIQSRKPPFTGQHVQSIINARQRVGVLDRRQIQPAVVHAESGPAVLLSHQYTRRRPRAVTWFDLASGQRLSNTSLVLFNLQRRHPARGTTDRRTVPGVDGMFHSIRVTGQGRAGHRK